jgi:hypothetical protein
VIQLFGNSHRGVRIDLTVRILGNADCESIQLLVVVVQDCVGIASCEVRSFAEVAHEADRGPPQYPFTCEAVRGLDILMLRVSNME